MMAYQRGLDMAKPTPQLYDLALVDKQTKAQLLDLLAQYGSAGIMQGTLDNVFISLLTKRYSLQDVLPYLYGGPIPNEWYLKPRRFDVRGLCLSFWNDFITEFTNNPRTVRPRLPSGTLPCIDEQPDTTILKQLTQLSFLEAVHTWIATCEEWLQICNIDWYRPYVENY